jgi:hypothetical protein
MAQLPPRAPAIYGVWIDQRFYRPGQFLPAGSEYGTYHIIVNATDEDKEHGAPRRVGAAFVGKIGISTTEIFERLSDELDRRSLERDWDTNPYTSLIEAE